MPFSISKDIVAHAVTALITASLTMSGAYFQMRSDLAQSEPDYVQKLQDRISLLESSLAKAQAQILSLSIKNADLQRMLGGSIEDVQLDGLFAYLDSMDRPAWCKQVEHTPGKPPVFRMRHLNYAYDIAFGVSAQKYVGGTDFDNHPEKIAQAYYDNDLRTYRSRDSFEFDEPISADEQGGQFNRRRFAKFFVALPTGPQLVCGVQVNAVGLVPSS